MPNQLQFEKSPYLLQHKCNPVDWMPWGSIAFETARTVLSLQKRCLYQTNNQHLRTEISFIESFEQRLLFDYYSEK